MDGGCGSVRPASHVAIDTQDTSGTALDNLAERPLVEDVGHGAERDPVRVVGVEKGARDLDGGRG